jgi:hypothetical protein
LPLYCLDKPLLDEPFLKLVEEYSIQVIALVDSFLVLWEIEQELELTQELE